MVCAVWLVVEGGGVPSPGPVRPRGRVVSGAGGSPALSLPPSPPMPPPSLLAAAAAALPQPADVPLSRPASFALPCLQGLARLRPPLGAEEEKRRGFSPPRSTFSLPSPPLPPWLLDVAGAGIGVGRGAWRGWPVRRDGGSLLPLFLPSFLPSGRRSARPDPIRVPSYRVPARRFKDPGGVALPPPGSGGWRARGGVPSAAAAPSPDSRPSPPRARPFPGLAAVPGREPPLGARGARPARAPCRSRLFFPSRPSLVSVSLFLCRLAGRPEASPLSALP